MYEYYEHNARVKFEYDDVGLTCMYVYLNLPNFIAFFCNFVQLFFWFTGPPLL